MGSLTRDNIKKKRKQARRLSLIRLFRLVILALFLWLISWAGFHFYVIGKDLYVEYKKEYDAYKLRRIEREKTWDSRFAEYTNVLILGIDAGLDEGAPTANTLVLASLVHATGEIRLIAIPRGTAIKPILPIEKVSQSAVSGVIQTVPLGSLYSPETPKGIALAVQNLLGVTVHQYAALDMDTAVQAVNLLGGLDFYVAETMRYEDPEQELTISFDPGYRHFDGQAAMQYLRYRGGDLGDIGRVERQQSFLRALYSKIFSLKMLPNLPPLAGLLRRRLVTDGEIWDVFPLLMPLWRMHEKRPLTFLLPGAIRLDGLANWQPDLAAIDGRVRELFPKAFEEETAKEAQ